MTDENTDDKTRAILVEQVRAYINSHGHGFQYSVLNETKHLMGLEWSPWQFEVAEFPVVAGGNTLHIDFVLKHRFRNAYLVGECKRANPALAHWCFVKAPYVRRDNALYDVTLEKVGRVKDSPDFLSCSHVYGHLRDLFHLVFELKTGAKGDSAGSTRGAADTAITQVFRATNGLVNTLIRSNSLVKVPEDWILMPVVFTTAQLWGVDVDLKDTEVDTGRLNAPPQVRPLQWLALNYPVSSDLRHVAKRMNRPESLSEALREEHIRTVFIVSPSGLDAFFKWTAEQ